MNEYPQATQDTLPTEPVHKELGVEGTGYRINHIEADSHSRFVVVTLPGFGGSASGEYTNLTEGNEQNPHGLAVSYLHEFDPETLTAGLVEEIKMLAAKGPVEVLLHACSYGASILPPLISKLKDMRHVHIQGILVRSPLYDRTCFTDKFLKADDDTLVRVFNGAIERQAKKDNHIIPPDEAKARDLLAKLPSAMDPEYAQTLRDNEIPLTTISFNGDRVINNERVQKLMGNHGQPLPLESSEDFMGHYPKDVGVMRTNEREWVASHMSRAKI